MYIECFCLYCNVNQGRDEVLGTPTCFADVNDNDLRNSFANNVNDKDNIIDNDNDLRSSFANNDNGNVNQGSRFAYDNDNDNDNDLRSSFANNDNDDRDNYIIYIYIYIG